MVERLRQMDTSAWVVSIGTVLMLLLSVGQNVFGAGGVLGHDAATVGQFQKQLDQMQMSIGALSDKIDHGPRMDQMQDIVRRLSEEAGRMDAYDARIRALEQLEAGMAVRVDGIDAASRAQLTGHK
jgi:hypothetical protein